MIRRKMKKIATMLMVMVLLISSLGTSTFASDMEDIFGDEEPLKVPESQIDEDISYVYDLDDYGYEHLRGACYRGENYLYIYDEHGVICGILDERGYQVVKYIYDENDIVSAVLELKNGIWTINSDDEFIGNKNRMLSSGMFFDRERNCYYINGRYFDPVSKKYMGGDDDFDLYLTENPFYVDSVNITPYSASDSESAAKKWAERCLASSTYGLPINYSDSWYSGLSNVDLLARAIFCEGGTKYKNEEDAVSWVMLNRINNSGFPDAAVNVVKQRGQFASITGGSAATENARKPSTGTARWEHSTYLACLLLTTTSKTEWTSIVGNVINGQLYFYSYTSAKNSYDTGSSPFSGTSNSTLKYKGKEIKNVQVIGYGKVSSFKSLFDSYSPTAYSRNIYYSYK